jgi:hypothetical protein
VLLCALFSELYDLTDMCSRQISRFMSYLEAQPNRRRICEASIEYDVGTFSR